MTGPSRAVFISHASQDAGTAARIAAALRSTGIEVWLDQSELRGGDAWDQRIRQEIRDCVLFIPVISANTAQRHEGYFRLEWDLADQRTHMIARNRAFIVPVCPDTTAEAGADVPESFHRVQWTRLPGGEVTPDFVAHVARLLGPETPREPAPAPSAAGPPPTVSPAQARIGARWRPARVLLLTLATAAVAVAAYFVSSGLRVTKHEVPPPAPAAASTAAAAPDFAPPAHSIAVLPFVNMSGDKEQEYFSDGLTEEILNALVRVNELQVTARTSSFSFKGKDTDVGTIARKLNVGAILEGSVRRSGRTLRITTQLVNAVTGFHLWSETYDRDLRDVLKLQTEIATAVAGALKVTLLGDVATKSELGGTRNPAALDAYLRAMRIIDDASDGEGLLRAAASLTEAIGLDPGYARAYADRSLTFGYYAANWASGRAVHDNFVKAGADAHRAAALAPELADAHRALGFFFAQTLEFRRAEEEYARATALAPGSAYIAWDAGLFATQMGRTEAGLATVGRATALDPVTEGTQETYGYALYLARLYKAALTAYGHAISLAPDSQGLQATRGLVYYALGDFEAARSACQEDSGVDSRVCLSVACGKLGRQAEAQATLAKFMKLRGDADAYAYAEIYAQWGDSARALQWLETALRLRDSGFILLKTDPLMDPLRHEPRFQAIMRELRFPD